jgi:NAD(P)-dependent dehydrogenase (short-subunit alcohol dehydrogenase family)
MTSVVVVGGTSGIGKELARSYAESGADVVLTGRDAVRAEEVAKEVGAGTSGSVTGIALELRRPEAIGAALAGVGRVDHLALVAIERDANTAADYDVARATGLVTLKLVGYSEVVHALLPRFSPDGSIVVFGGLAKDKPYPGSLTVSTINGGVVGLVNALAVELPPIRVNGVHPGIVGDSPYWQSRPPEVVEGFRARTPTGTLATMADVVSAVRFLLDNRSVNGVNLAVDGGWLLT